MTYSEIEEISAVPRRLNSGPYGWGFCMWSPLFDGEAPHRRLLERVAAAHPAAGIKLPRYYLYEDFVEAVATWNGASVSIYYETTLSYLSLWSANREAVASFRTALLPLIA